ncbi:MAG: hypothetical protein K2Q01_08685, partial [Rickettsiales bacterium]|nr:hypothetical protein [Rickettsiales bacterium]
TETKPKEPATPPPKKKAGAFFGKDVREEVKQEPNQKLLADARNTDARAGVYAAVSTVYTADVLVQAVRRLAFGHRRQFFKDRVGDILKSMDPVVEAAENEIMRRERASSRGTGTS